MTVKLIGTFFLTYTADDLCNVSSEYTKHNKGVTLFSLFEVEHIFRARWTVHLHVLLNVARSQGIQNFR